MVQEKPSRTWESREIPMLEVIALDEQQGSGVPLASDVIGMRAGLADRDVAVGLRALHEADYVTGAAIHTTGGWSMINVRLTERGRRAVGQWPSDDLADELIRILDARIERAHDEGERSRLKKLRDAALDVGRGLLSDALFEVARGNIRF